MAQKGHKNETYDEYITKFEQKRTKDDTFTPPEVYNAVQEWVTEHYGKMDIVRPFWPGKDYQKEEYPDGCLVLDNPPFSISTQIARWYIANNIKFFLFCQGTTAFTFLKIPKCNIIVATYSITYDNKAKVSTSFVTNLEGPRILIAASLYQKLKSSQTKTNQQRKILYPENIFVSSEFGPILRGGKDIEIKKARYIGKINKVNIFGGGAVIPEEDAAKLKKFKKLSKEYDLDFSGVVIPFEEGGGERPL